MSQLATGAVVFFLTPGKWVKVGSGDPAERIGGGCFSLGQDWLEVGVEQPEDKETCHGRSCARSGDAPAEAPAGHSVSTGCSKHATVLGNPCASPARRQAELEYLQNAGPRYHSVHWAAQGLKPW